MSAGYRMSQRIDRLTQARHLRGRKSATTGVSDAARTATVMWASTQAARDCVLALLLPLAASVWTARSNAR